MSRVSRLRCLAGEGLSSRASSKRKKRRCGALLQWRHGMISQMKVATPMRAGGPTAGRLMSRTVVWLVATGAAVLAAALGVAWLGKQSDPAGMNLGANPAASTAAAEKADSPPSLQSPAAAFPGPLPTTIPPAVPMPTFDVARIEPDGRAVIAGRAQPGAKVVLLEGDKEIAQSR